MIPGQVIATDGKTIRGAKEHGKCLGLREQTCTGTN
jgi:hypothetical protein